MSEIKLTIDGREVAGRSGETILKVCQDHGIPVPTLCHHAYLSDVGACRMCIVEVEGERRLNTACTTPARDGMVVRTDTERLRKQRLLTLELLFSERNHICPFCAQSGACELQDMGYALGMTHPRYPYLYPKLAPDASSPHFILDPNRCILCGRCVRACDEIVGVHTLDFEGRGARQLILADRGVPIGESGCIACGTCVEVCPTGALFEKRNAYWSRERDLPTVATTCPACGVGCRFEAALKHGRIVRHQGLPDAPVNGPLLCAKGRFRLLEDSRARLLKPLVRRDGELREVGWPEAFDAAAGLIRAARRPSRVGGLISARLPNEALYLFQKLLRQTVGTNRVASLDAGDLRVRREAAHRLTGNGADAPVECGLEAAADADAFLVVGADLGETHPVVAAWVSKAVYQRQAPLIVVSSRKTSLAGLADVWIRPRRGREGVVLNGLLNLLVSGQTSLPPVGGGPGRGLKKEARAALAAYSPEAVAAEAQVSAADLAKAAGVYAKAGAPLILYGRDLTRYGDPGLVLTLLNLALTRGKTPGGRLRVCGLAPEASSVGACELGMTSDLALETLNPLDLDCLYLVLGDADLKPDEAVRDQVRSVRNLIVQSSHASPLTDAADLVLPGLAWFERSGTFLNTDGRLQPVARVLAPPPGLMDDTEVFSALAGRLGTAWSFEAGGVQREMGEQAPAFKRAFGNGGAAGERPAADLGRASVQVVSYL